MARNKISTTVYLTPSQDAALKNMPQRCGISASAFIRLAIDLLLDEDDQSIVDAYMAAMKAERQPMPSTASMLAKLGTNDPMGRQEQIEELLNDGAIDVELASKLETNEPR